MSHKEKLINLLRQHKVVTMGLLVEMDRSLVYRAVQRIHDLRRQGYIIHSVDEHDVDFLRHGYELISEPLNGVSTQEAVRESINAN